MKFFLACVFLPFSLFCNLSEFFAEEFGKALQEENLSKCEEIVSQWGFSENLEEDEILGLRGCISLCKGEIEFGKSQLKEALQTLPSSALLDSMKDVVNDLEAKNITLSSSDMDLNNFSILLCKRKQPKGLKIRYWFGIAQIVAGCIVAPFNLGAGGSLIAAGVTTVVYAGADAMDNKEAWEQAERDRQKMNPDFKKSFFTPHVYRREYSFAC